MILLDADALLVLRHLQLIDAVLACESAFAITSYVATHELNSLQAEIEAHVAAGALRVEAVTNKTPAWSTWRTLRRTADKGEAEIIAWAVHSGEECLMVSNDNGARTLATKQRVQACDVLELLVQLIRDERLDRDLVAARLGNWEDDPHSFGRPKRFTTVDNALPLDEA